MTMTTSLLEVHEISKAFPGTQALDQVSFELRPGEVHALVGENGAGKSTLMHILSGVLRPDSGEIRLAGERVEIQNPRHAQDLGIGMVFQELSLVPSLSIAENIFPNRAPVRFAGVIDWQALQRKTRDLLAQFELDVDPQTPVRALSISNRQIIEILKALSLNPKVLLFDEPTSALPPDEVELLFATIQRLKANGIGIVFTSHRIPEIMAIADRVTVLRDGHKIGTYVISEITPDDLIEAMVGRKLTEMFPERNGGNGRELLRVEHLTHEGVFWDVSLTLRAGEIVGLAGLKGAHRGEFLRALVGVEPVDAGQVWLEGQPVRITSPVMAVRRGIAYLPEERKTDGLFLKMPLRQNTSVVHLAEFARLGVMNRRKETARALEFIQRLRIVTPGPDQLVGRLSGGNQQKVMLSKWLVKQPRILIVEEPTKGVDVGAKAEIHALLRELARQGVGILFSSSEFQEIIGLSDRIVVMHEGRIVSELAAENATEHDLTLLASGYAANHVQGGE
ncbi:MAG: sugar ABC transporter ATP-binding protein [Anaerolineae bacterium]